MSTPASPIRRKIRLVMALFAISFFGWQLYSMQAKNVDADLLQSRAGVEVTVDDKAFTFKPAIDTAGVGLLFYPGALVDPVAYVPMANAIAEAGYEATIIKIPYRMAAMEWQNSAVQARTMDRLQGKRWVLGGHSRGARMALEFARLHESKLAGLALVGSSHPREINDSKFSIPIMKVYGSADGLASQREVEEYRNNLPAHTRWELIKGGNHAQFAWYGKQLGDDKATISREEQQAQLLASLLSFLQSIN